MTADDWIEKLGLDAHPEGGYFAETYRSELPAQAEKRVLMTSIYFLLKSGQVSKFHRLKSDELWYFHAGASVTIYLISEAGELSQVELGIEGEGVPQVLIPKNTWFAAEVNAPDHFALMGCAVAPGFEFEDFELADKDSFLKQFPGLDSDLQRFL